MTGCSAGTGQGKCAVGNGAPVRFINGGYMNEFLLALENHQGAAALCAMFIFIIVAEWRAGR